MTRQERANQVKKRHYFSQYGDQARAVMEGLLDKYADEGLQTIESNNVLKLKPFSDMGAPMEVVKNAFGSKKGYENAVRDLGNELFKQDDVG